MSKNATNPNQTKPMHLIDQIRALNAELVRMKAEGQELSHEFKSAQKEQTRLMGRYLELNRPHDA